MISFLDLNRQYKSIQSEIDTAISSVIQNSAYIGGQNVSTFEKGFADFLGLKHCIGCANGTDSIEILLKSFGISEGDEVIVPAISWISTSEAVSSLGAIPVFVDIDKDFYTLDLNLIESKITNKTKAIIPVHLYGQPVDMTKLMGIAKKYNLIVIEDCAQAHGSMFNEQLVGTFGDAASFSFYPGKNLGAYGDAGGMVTNNEEIASKSRRTANHGQEGKHNHIEEGRNSRLDGLQAAILNVKLPHLNSWINGRNEVAKAYNKGINNSKFVLPKVIENGKHSYHLYVIRTEKRDELQAYLKEKQIDTAIHYPKALPFLNCYIDRGFSESDFPVAAKIQNEILSIPMYPELTNEEIQFIIDALNNF
jgi:dTDP-4-amino-4,6-dideoxygalactose transaminase